MMTIDELKIILLKQIRDPSSDFCRYLINPNGTETNLTAEDNEMFRHFRIDEYGLGIAIERIHPVLDGEQQRFACVFFDSSQVDFKSSPWHSATNLSAMSNGIPTVFYQEFIEFVDDCIVFSLHRTTIICNDYDFVAQPMSADGTVSITFDISDKVFKPSNTPEKFINWCKRILQDSSIHYSSYHIQNKDYDALGRVNSHFVVDMDLIEMIEYAMNMHGHSMLKMIEFIHEGITVN